jgi:hypothetical protein
MSPETLAGIAAVLTALISVMGIVSKLGRALASLEEAVKQL